MAQANASMPYALQVFDYRYWFVYVAAMIAVEAFIIGRSVGTGWLKSIGICILANLFSALLCPEVYAVVLHADSVSVNPLLYVTTIFVFTGIVSALVEAAIWSLFARRTGSASPVVWPSLKAHAIGVPIALAILLIPEHPYIGIEGTVTFWRGHQFETGVKRQLKAFLDENDGRIPRVESTTDFIEQYLSSGNEASSALEIAYLPDYSRFDTGEMRRRPLRWNPALSNINLRDALNMGKEFWIARAITRLGKPYGFVLKQNNNNSDISVVQSSDPRELGYSTS